MRIEVNGVRLFFGVAGAKLVPDGPTVRRRRDPAQTFDQETEA